MSKIKKLKEDNKTYTNRQLTNAIKNLLTLAG